MEFISVCLLLGELCFLGCGSLLLGISCVTLFVWVVCLSLDVDFFFLCGSALCRCTDVVSTVSVFVC